MQPSSEDPIVQEIPWVIMGMTIPVQISASGKIFVDGSPVLQLTETDVSRDTTTATYEPPLF